MPKDPVGRLDLNLVFVFDALLRYQSVTRAATALNLTQGAVSHALRRLRTFFRDPLFTRTATGIVPTPRGPAVREDDARSLLRAAACRGGAPRISAKRSAQSSANRRAHIAPGIATARSSGCELRMPIAAHLVPMPANPRELSIESGRKL
jgi:DNA-binding transcriptional LysR family regulator